ncbi:MAG TPA: biotin/lipoyl-containing protein, partial [Nocardioides sp.]|nr:biotin/lipoyl-containing protein [Nocardioides sp.]
MATEVNLPALGESVTEGTVTRWLKQVGDEVAVDEPLLEVSTDKVDTEIPSPVAGTLLEIKANEDDTVEVGAVLALVGEEGEGSDDSGGADSAEPEAQPKDEENAEKKAEQEEQVEEETGDLPPGDETSESEKSDGQEEPAASGGESGGSGSGGGGGGGDGTPVTLPALGESVTEGTVTRWLKQVGDEVAVDEPLLEVSTDKVDTEIPSPVAGTLLEIKAEEDETVEVGAELAIIGSGEAAQGSSEPAQEQEQEQEEQPEPEQQEAQPEQKAEPEAEPEQEPEPEQQEAEEKPQEQPAAEQEQAPAQEKQAPAQQAPSHAAASGGEGHGYVTPLVRKLATQHGVDLASVTGTGVGGRIRKQDV